MREAKIILPVICGDLSETLVGAFGGCTVVTGSGHWKHPVTGRTVSEAVRIYTVAVEFNPTHRRDTSVLDALEGIAKAACIAGNQECVYLQYPTGSVVLVNQRGENVKT